MKENKFALSPDLTKNRHTNTRNTQHTTPSTHRDLREAEALWRERWRDAAHRRVYLHLIGLALLNSEFLLCGVHVCTEIKGKCEHSGVNPFSWRRQKMYFCPELHRNTRCTQYTQYTHTRMANHIIIQYTPNIHAYSHTS